MKTQAWRRQPAAYPDAGTVQPRVTDLDAWQHLNNVSQIGLHGELLQQWMQAHLGDRLWRSSTPLLALRGTVSGLARGVMDLSPRAAVKRTSSRRKDRRGNSETGPAPGQTSAVGRISRTCWNAQRLWGGLSQSARGMRGEYAPAFIAFTRHGPRRGTAHEVAHNNSGAEKNSRG